MNYSFNVTVQHIASKRTTRFSVSGRGGGATFAGCAAALAVDRRWPRCLRCVVAVLASAGACLERREVPLVDSRAFSIACSVRLPTSPPSRASSVSSSFRRTRRRHTSAAIVVPRVDAGAERVGLAFQERALIEGQLRVVKRVPDHQHGFLVVQPLGQPQVLRAKFLDPLAESLDLLLQSSVLRAQRCGCLSHCLSHCPVEHVQLPRVHGPRGETFADRPAHG